MAQLLQYYRSFQNSRQQQATTSPTFEDLTIDPKLSAIERLVRYHKSSISLQR